jgi:hypothetical protein
MRRRDNSLNAQRKWTSEDKRFNFSRVSVKSAEIEIEIRGKRYELLGVRRSINENGESEIHFSFAVS